MALFQTSVLKNYLKRQDKDAIADAIAAIKTPVIEVHISNVYTREDFRHHSYLSKYCVGVIVGFGLKSYELAIQAFLKGVD